MVIIVVLLLISTFLIAFHLAKMSDPYIKEVLSRQGNVSRGYEIFQINCAACHGQFADGIVGPSLEEVSHRKSRISLIEQVISGKTPPMPKFQPDPQAMADLLVYLENLSKKWLLADVDGKLGRVETGWGSGGMGEWGISTKTLTPQNPNTLKPPAKRTQWPPQNPTPYRWINFTYIEKFCLYLGTLVETLNDKYLCLGIPKLNRQLSKGISGKLASFTKNW